ncbi:hypothetical protein P153DRAFT_96775 [Dothidotthia symphoricarpi CBS 119687]|uniref:Uncharacterized protein n=1 Tax=Dothidotthia symphoricarpi CBS 119687 TaxID=1392245 RepID=A0A6A6AS56_9PLEO|nr:uncharacterized protein P153DRAFT_96775 [Dothidotthia symphoricarpi CBS 119687]KAF2133677.1 hypothetical protein P153DRAFT_96775 [Dothidotthia symphoricarpi CBS 119687]
MRSALQCKLSTIHHHQCLHHPRSPRHQLPEQHRRRHPNHPKPQPGHRYPFRPRRSVACNAVKRIPSDLHRERNGRSRCTSCTQPPQRSAARDTP